MVTLRAGYFLYPSENYIEGSLKAFVSLFHAMKKKKKFALCRLIARKTSEPKLVALYPQDERRDELGTVHHSLTHSLLTRFWF